MFHRNISVLEILKLFHRNSKRNTNLNQLFQIKRNYSSFCTFQNHKELKVFLILTWCDLAKHSLSIDYSLFLKFLRGHFLITWCFIFKLPQWIVPFTWYGHRFWLRISSVYLIWPTDFDCEFFYLHNLDTLILTYGFCIWNGAHSECNQLTGCLLLLGTWFHLRYIQGSMLAHLFLWLIIPTFFRDWSLFGILAISCSD
jgi:hypothetical protein